jgi:hypothetical protein
LALAAQLAVLVFIPLAISGCGRGTGKVSGQVLFQGNPLPGGVVRFRPVDTKLNPVTAEIDADGKYEATVPAGECKISVDNRALLNPEGGSPVGVGGGGGGAAIKASPGGPPKGAAFGPPKDAMQGVGGDQNVPNVSGKKPVGKYLDIPKNYYDPETSGLTLNVKRGTQSHNIELK